MSNPITYAVNYKELGNECSHCGSMGSIIEIDSEYSVNYGSGDWYPRILLCDKCIVKLRKELEHHVKCKNVADDLRKNGLILQA